MSFSIQNVLVEEAVNASVLYIDSTGGGGGGVQSVSGTANQITASGTTNVSLSLPTDVEMTNLTLEGLKLTTGAGADLVLTSDADGNASWQVGGGGLQNVYGTANEITATPNGADVTLSLPSGISVGSVLDTTGNATILAFQNGTGSNYVNVSNSNTTPTISTAGTSTDIDLLLSPKNAGVVSIPRVKFPTNPAANYVLTSDASGNGTWQPNVKSISGTTNEIDVSGTNDVTLSLPNNVRISSSILDSNDNIMIAFSPVTNADSYFAFRNRLGDGSLIISATGAANNLNLTLAPKGTGVVSMPRFQLTTGAVANYVLTSDASGNGTWQAAAASGVQSVGVTANQTRNTGTSTDPVIALTDSVKIVQGLLDTNSNNMLAFSATLSAANYLTIANAASGSSPTLSATGGNPNIDIVLAPQGSGRVEMSGIRVTSATPITANWVLTTDASGNGTWQASNSLSPFVVGSGCTYTTIQSAVTAAQFSGGNIYIKPGTYTENLTLYDNINLIGFAEYNALNDVSHSNVIINGNITIASSAVDVNLQGLLLNTSSGSVISFTNTNSSEVYLYNCAIQQTAVDGIFDFPTGVGGIVRMERCAIFSSSSPFVTDAGGAGGIIFSVLNSEITLGALFTISQNFTLTLKNSTFENDTYDMTLDGSIQIISIIQSIFTSNIVSTGSTNSFNMSKTTFTGIFINTQSSLSSNNVSISDCTINGNIDFGTSAGGTTNITFKNCTMYQSLSNYTLSVGDSSTTINVYDSIMQIITMSRRDTTVTSTINAYNSQFNGSIIDDTTLTNTFNFTNCFLTNFNFGSLTSIEQVKTTNLYNCTQGLGVVNKFCGQGLINSGTSTVQASITTTGPSATAELCAISVPAYNGNNQMIYYKAVVQGKLKDTGSPVVSNVIAGTAFGVYYNDGTTLSLIGNTADYSIKKTASGASGGDIILVIGSSLMIPYVALQVTSPSTVGSGVDFQWVAQVTYQYL